MTKLIIALEIDQKPMTAAHHFAQCLNLVRESLQHGITMGVLETNWDSRVRGAWLFGEVEEER